MGFLKDGKKVEKDFAKLYPKSEIIYSDKNEDINEHWDLKIDGKKYDVKGLKKIMRSDPYTNEFYHYIEIKNVNGDLGWLYGDADYFAFQTNRYFIIVDKIKLQTFIKENVKKLHVDNVDESLYCLYSRNGRKDVITMITTIDLCDISGCIKEYTPSQYDIGTSIIPEIKKNKRINDFFNKK